MQQIHRSHPRLAFVPVLVFSGFLAFPSGAFAHAMVEPDVPSVKRAPEPRTVDEQIKLAGDYLAGRGVAQNLKLAAYWYEKAANSGDPEAQQQIGYLYDAGIGVAKDPARAARWYQLAAAGGSAAAKVNLGILYLWGTGVKKDQQLAARLFGEAVQQGNGKAACFLGDMYYLGLGAPQDKAAGEQWYVKGIQMHDPQAEYDLGLLFFDAKDHAHDLHKAATLLRESAAAGDVPAMFSLGLLLARNPDFARSPDEAVALLNEAADSGIWKSSMILGVLSRDGKGVPPDNSAAYYHFRIAALQGGEEARNLLENDLQSLAAKLDRDRVAALDARAEDWYKHHQTVLEFVYREGQDRARFPAYALAVPENGTHTAQILPAQPN